MQVDGCLCTERHQSLRRAILCLCLRFEGRAFAQGQILMWVLLTDQLNVLLQREPVRLHVVCLGFLQDGRLGLHAFVAGKRFQRALYSHQVGVGMDYD